MGDPITPSCSAARALSKAFLAALEALMLWGELCGELGAGSCSLEKACSNLLALRGTRALGEAVLAACLHVSQQQKN